MFGYLQHQLVLFQPVSIVQHNEMSLTSGSINHNSSIPLIVPSATHTSFSLSLFLSSCVCVCVSAPFNHNKIQSETRIPGLAPEVE